MKSLSRFASSFASYISEATSSIDSEQRIEDVRAGMLDALTTMMPLQAVGRSRTLYSVAGATDIQTLWYLRSNVLHALADCHGEQIASTRQLRAKRPSGQTPRA